MIQTLIISLFNIRCNCVQNLKIFIDHLESQNTCASTTLKYEFWKIQASSYHCLGSKLISEDTFDIIIIIY